jgi:hypothetical protein
MITVLHQVAEDGSVPEDIATKPSGFRKGHGGACLAERGALDPNEASGEDRAADER